MLLLFTATLWKKKPGLDAVQCFPQHGSKAKHCSFISLISKAGFFIYLFIFFPHSQYAASRHILMFFVWVETHVLFISRTAPLIDE